MARIQLLPASAITHFMESTSVCLPTLRLIIVCEVTGWGYEDCQLDLADRIGWTEGFGAKRSGQQKGRQDGRNSVPSLCTAQHQMTNGSSKGGHTTETRFQQASILLDDRSSETFKIKRAFQNPFSVSFMNKSPSDQYSTKPATPLNLRNHMVQYYWI